MLDVGVAYDEDPDKVLQILEAVGNELAEDEEWSDKIMDRVEVFGLDQFADSALVFKTRLRTKPLEQWGVGREFRKRLKRAFDSADVTIPFPQRTLHLSTAGRAARELVAN